MVHVWKERAGFFGVCLEFLVLLSYYVDAATDFIEHLHSGDLHFIFFFLLHVAGYFIHTVVNLKSDTDSGADLVSIVNTHAYKVSHFFKLLLVFLTDVTDHALFISFVDELDDSVWKLAIFSKYRPDHEVFGTCRRTLVVNFIHKVRFLVSTVRKVNFSGTEHNS